ncbi:MAG TPA: hypothetical protein PLU30_09565 [Verrucomicrobiae bacterium]|nr:hypothetical protein [Verrucomicrobiae bacterium]
MRVLRLGWAAVIVLGLVIRAVGADVAPADVAKAVSAKLGLPGGTMPLAIRVIESEGARKWELMFEDGNFKGNRRLVEFQGDKVVDDRAGTIDGVGSGALTPLLAGDLESRITELRERAGILAKMAEVDCHRVRLILFRPAADATAHWEVEVADRTGQVVGRVVFGCPQPRLIASSWGADAKIVGPAQGGIEALGMEGVKALQDLEERLRRLLQGQGEKEK